MFDQVIVPSNQVLLFFFSPLHTHTTLNTFFLKLSDIFQLTIVLYLYNVQLNVCLFQIENQYFPFISLLFKGATLPPKGNTVARVLGVKVNAKVVGCVWHCTL